MQCLIYISVIFGILALPLNLSAKSNKSLRTLKFPDEKSGEAWIGPERSVNALIRADNQLYLLAQQKNILLKHPFDSSLVAGKRFKQTTDTVRFEIPASLQLSAWRALEKFKTSVVLLESVHLSFSVWSIKDNKEIHRFSIPRDLLKSTRDAVGEPTRTETSQMRARFAKEFQLAEDKPKFVGLSLVPEKYKHNDKVEFLVLSKLESFPLLKIGCADEDDLGSCRVQRVCDLNLPKSKKGRTLQGLTYSKKRDLFYFGNHDENAIYGFQYRSCGDIRLKNTLKLPSEIKSFSQLHVDQDDRLWVTSFTPDDKQDSSIVYFENW